MKNTNIYKKINDLPFLGVGIAWVDDDPEFKKFAYEELNAEQNYLEIHLPTNLSELPDEIPKVAHSSWIPFADEREPNINLVNHVFKQAKELNCYWLGDHISILGTSSGVTFGYIFPPINDSSLETRIQKRVLNYIENTNIPIVMEMGPRYWSLNNEDGLSDYKMLKEVSQNTGVPIIFDIPHCLTAAKNTGVDFSDIVNLLKDVNVLEVHIGAQGFSSEQKEKNEEWDALKLCLDTFKTIKGVTVEYSNNDFEDYKSNVIQLSELVYNYKENGLLK